MSQEQGSYTTNPIRQTQVVLTNAQIKASPITPIKVVDCPSDKSIAVLYAIVQSNIVTAYTLSTAGAITSASKVELTWDSGSANPAIDTSISAASILGTTTETTSFLLGFNSDAISTSNVLGKSVYAWGKAENSLAFLGGDAANTLTITVLYMEI